VVVLDGAAVAVVVLDGAAVAVVVLDGAAVAVVVLDGAALTVVVLDGAGAAVVVLDGAAAVVVVGGAAAAVVVLDGAAAAAVVVVGGGACVVVGAFTVTGPAVIGCPFESVAALPSSCSVKVNEPALAAVTVTVAAPLASRLTVRQSVVSPGSMSAPRATVLLLNPEIAMVRVICSPTVT